MHLFNFKDQCERLNKKLRAEFEESGKVIEDLVSSLDYAQRLLPQDDYLAGQ